MDIPIKVTKGVRFQLIVNILSCIEPFKSLRPREIEALGKMLELHYELRAIPKDQQGLLMFHKDNVKKICDTMSPPMTMDNYYNLKLEMKKKGIIDDTGIVEKYLNVFMKCIDGISFKFIEK